MEKKDNGNKFLVVSGIFSAGLLMFAIAEVRLVSPRPPAAGAGPLPAPEAAPAQSAELPVVWGDLGQKLVVAGVIDEAKFTPLPAERIVMTKENASRWLNMLWAFGLANKNPILEQGPMQDPRYGGAGHFASTGGWTLAKGDAMEHYSAHELVVLTADEQTLVARVAQNIYRPCCGNSAYFPDCNHGMAMLGLLELMAAQGASEDAMYRAALAVNSYWFPDNYRTIERYLESRRVAWDKVAPKELLGANYSSGQGYANIVSLTEPVKEEQPGSCGV